MEKPLIQLDSEHFIQIIHNRKYNEEILKHYEKLKQEIKSKTIENKIENLKNCNSYHLLDKYQEQKVMEHIKTNLCKDKFCSNCKKVKQAARMSKFMPEIEKYKDRSYQMVLTVPNCSAELLKGTIKKLFKAHTRLIEYLKGKEKIKGLDFSKYGYEGAIRSLEVTYSKKDYHPHLHILLVLNGDPGQKVHKNQYSKDHHGKRVDRLFSKLEILIQKIWYLLNNDIKVTKKAIEGLEVGYSCSLDKFKENDYLELFKYMTKVKNDSDLLMTYENFKTLYFSLDGVRQIQGYGVFYNIKDDDSHIEEIDSIYTGYVEKLRERENPQRVGETPEDLEKSEFFIFSRKKFIKNYKSILAEP